MSKEINFTTYTKPDNLPKFGSISQIISYIKPGEDVLDVGCSQGYLGFYLKQSNNVYGVDYNPEALEVAKDHCVDTVCLDLNIVPNANIFAGKKFDVIVFADVLEHVLYPDKILEFFKQFLKPKGRIIISLPNVALWRVRLNLLFGEFNYTDYGVLDKTHLHLYTFKTAQEFAKKNGLEVLSLSGAANLLGYLVHYFPISIIRNLFSIQIVMVCQQK